MRVNLNDGSNVEVNLAAKMNASFTKDNFVISGGENDIKVPRADIKSFTFHEAARDGIENVGADNAAPVIDGDSMTFGNLPEDRSSLSMPSMARFCRKSPFRATTSSASRLCRAARLS